MKWRPNLVVSRDAILENRWIRPFAHRLGHPSLWHLNRRSVSRGVALGLVAGFMIPVGQIIVAAVLALSVRANIIVAASFTFVTNPLTFPAIYYAAYRVGYQSASQFSREYARQFGVPPARDAARLRSEPEPLEPAP